MMFQRFRFFPTSTQTSVNTGADSWRHSGGTRSRASVFGRVALVATVLCAAAVLPASAADTVINLDGGSQTGSFNGRGPIDGSYTIHGPGTFTSTGRVYPNNLSYIVTFDQGAVVWITTHNAATDGLIVSGNQKCEVHLGNCTVGSCKTGAEICLARYVTLVLDDEEVGASITTKNNSGTAIVMQTNPSQQAVVKGSGKLNLVGGGTFRFDSKTTFSNTGLTTVDDNTTALLNTAVPPCPFLLKNGGTLKFAAATYLPTKHVTVESGGVLDLGEGSGERSFSNGITFKDGAILRVTVGATAPKIDSNRTDADWNSGKAIYFPKKGGKVTISPQAGTGLVTGRYPLFNNLVGCGIDVFTLDKTTLGGFNLSLDMDGWELVLVVSENAESPSAVWSGGASGAWSGANWNDGETFPAGKEARFATPGASVTLDAGSTTSVARLAFDASATVSGEGTLAMPAGRFYVAEGCTATIDADFSLDTSYFVKYGAGILAVNAARLGIANDIRAYEGQIEFRLQAGESATIKTTGNTQREGGISYIGPGTFTSQRLYPRTISSTNFIDGGATLILSGNNAGDGLMVSAWRTGEDIESAGTIALGDCTIRSSYTVDTVLQRGPKIMFTDTVNGTTISTDGANGSPIRIHTNKQGIFLGSGRMNIAGSGTFYFDVGPSFLQTGEMVVKSGANAILANDVPLASFRVENGGTIAGSGNMPRAIGALTIEPGGKFGNGNTYTMIAPSAFTCAAGETFDFVVGEASAGGQPLLDLRGASLSIGAETTVRVLLTGAMPDGTYDIVWYDAADAAQIANLSFTFVDDIGSGCTGTISASNGAASLNIGGSSASPVNVWRGLGVDGAWSRDMNWTAHNAPFANGMLTFTGTNKLVNVNDTGLTSFPSLSFTSDAGAFDIDLNGAGQGMATIANSSGSKQTVRGYVNTGALAKSGSKEVELVDPVIGGKLTMDSGAPLAIRATEGNTVTVNSNGGAASFGTFRYLGPGAFLTSRIYPNSSSVPVSFEEGATVWITSHRGRTDGLIVAGGTDRTLKVGYCTIGSRFNATTELLRAVSIEFTDTSRGATVTTDSVDGNPITITTANNADQAYRNKGYFKGKGRFNIGGHGTFEFDPQTTFLHTGATFIGADATAVVKPDVGYTNSAITVAGTLRFEGGTVSKKVTVQNGGVVENPGAATVSGGMTLADGAKVVLPVAADGTVTRAACAITPPSSGTVAVELACASRNLAKNTPIALTQGAGLAAGAEAKFAVVATSDGTPITGLKTWTSISEGELCVEFRSKGLVITVR